MKLVYSSGKLEKLCMDEREMKRQRSDIAPKLRLRIKALQMASSMTDLMTLDPLGRWHELTGDRAGHWSGHLSRNWRIIVEELQEAQRVEVTVLVVELQDYH